MPAHLHGAWNPYLGSLIYEFTSTAACRPASSSATSPLAPPEGIRPGLSPTAVDAYTPYLKPYHAAEVVNHQLYSVEPSRWTAVCSDNILMRKLLQAYFLQEHDWHAFVQKDYFLQDMARMRNDFCSPLLVNALLAAACVRFLPSPPRPLALSPAGTSLDLWALTLHKHSTATVNS